MCDFNNYCAKWNYYDDSNMLVVGRMKDEMDAIVMENFVYLKPKMCLILVMDSNESKRAKILN